MELFHLHRTNMVQWIDPSSCQTKIPKKTRKFPIGSIYGKKTTKQPSVGKSSDEPSGRLVYPNHFEDGLEIRTSWCLNQPI